MSVKSSERPSIYSDNYNLLSEALKGKVETNTAIFPQQLGEEHPFDFEAMEKISKKGVLKAIIDKYVDYVMSGGIQVECEDDKAKQILDNFMIDNDFDTNVREWLRECFRKGTGFMELGSGKGGTIDGMKVLNSNFMYIVRNDIGEITGYNQYLRPMNKFKNFNSNKDIEPFKVTEVAHISIDRCGDDCYGLGLIFPLLMDYNRLLCSQEMMHKYVERKAEDPFIWVGGDKTKGEYPTKDEMNAMGGALESLKRKNNWVVSDFWKPVALNFGSAGEKFQFVVDDDTQKLYSSAQIPMVLMGVNVAEGIAKYQTRTFELRIQSLREEIEKVIESKIFKRILNIQGIDQHAEVVWGLPSQEEKMANATIIIEALKNPFLSEPMKIMLEQKLAKNFDISENDIKTMEEEREDEETKEEQPIVPEQRQKEPATENIHNHNHNKLTFSKEKFDSINEFKVWVMKEGYNGYEITETPSNYILHNKCNCEENSMVKLKEDSSLINEIHDAYKISEWVGFNYSDYLEDVIKVTQADSFEDIKAITNEMKRAGMLSSNEIEKVRITFEEGFRENLTIREIQNRLNKRIEFKDRLALHNGKIMTRKGEPIVAVKAKYRANMITRSETVRLSNLGALENYKKNDIEKVRWISAVSDRTCEQCMQLNGQIMEVAKLNVRPPLHTMCRCTMSPFIE